MTHKALFFQHPMIYIRDGWFIDKAKTGRVRWRHASELSPNEKFLIAERPHPWEADRVVQRAIARLGQERYDPVTSNCQHFANEVLTGVSRSEQVEAAATVATLALLMVAVTALDSRSRRTA